MNERHESAITPPISFAEGGASAVESADTIAAFELALRLGAGGLASTAWLSADSVPVLHGTASIRRGFRRASLASLESHSLGPGVCTLGGLYSELGAGFELSLAVGGRATADAVLRVVGQHEQSSGNPVTSRLWLCRPDWQQLARWRSSYPMVSLVNVARLAEMSNGPERRAAQLADAGVTAVSMPYSDWTAGLVVLFRRFGIVALGRDAQHERMLDELLGMGIDGMYSAHVDRMSSAMRRAGVTPC